MFDISVEIRRRKSVILGISIVGGIGLLCKTDYGFFYKKSNFPQLTGF